MITYIECGSVCQESGVDMRAENIQICIAVSVVYGVGSELLLSLAQLNL